MNKLHTKQRSRAQSQTKITHRVSSDTVYDQTYSEAHPRAYPKALPSNLYVGGLGCPHPEGYQIDGTCSLCFLSFAFQGELPGQIHHSKVLTTNGNPRQTDKFTAHVGLVEGFKPPKPSENLHQFQRSRSRNTAPAHKIYPVSSVLWELMGYQPPLATPLIMAVSGYTDPQIAEFMDISIYNLHERLLKAVRITLRWIK